jgi:hypothetical protein
MIPKKRVSSGNCLHLRLELDSTNNGFQRAQRLPSPGRSELGATKNHLEAAQVYGMVRCAWGLETVGLEAVKSDTSDIAETRNSFWRPRIQT